jgi:hypothetical protein
MTRRFARFRAGTAPLAPGYFGLPSDGMCLNVFLVVRAPDDPHRALVGRPAADPRWEEVGALDPPRRERLGDRWMLPCSQLVLLEGPEEAARRIGAEQLGIEITTLPSPTVVSEKYPLHDSAEHDLHWDLHFIYPLLGPPHLSQSALWKELEYLPIAQTPRSAFGRGHGDILELVGLTPIG